MARYLGLCLKQLVLLPESGLDLPIGSWGIALIDDPGERSIHLTMLKLKSKIVSCHPAMTMDGFFWVNRNVSTL